MPTVAAAQASQNAVGNRIALKLDETTSAGLSAEELEAARNIGIDLLEVSFPNIVNPSVLSEYSLLLDTGQRFRTINELSSNLETIAGSIQSHYNAVPESLLDNVVAIKLFDFPADYDQRFPATVRGLLSQLSDSLDKPVFYQSAFGQPDFPPELFDFVSSRTIVPKSSSSIPEQTVLLFTPSEDLAESLRMLEEILNHSLNYSESVIIIPAEWFLSRIEFQEGFSQIITSYLKGNSITFPMPENKKSYPRINWPVVFLLALWASFIIHYKHQPMYKSSLPRYFFNHSFFIHDVMEQRIRTAASGVIVLLQHAFLTGFFFYLLADVFISETGLDALNSHFPIIIYPGFEELCLFIIGVIIALLSHIVSTFWLYLLNKELKQLSQAINLYSWPLHINLIIVTLVVYFTQLSSAQNWLIGAAIAYFLVWFLSFKIAAIDGAKYLKKFRPLNLFLTVGLHFLLIITVIVLIIWLPFIFEPLEMAFRLP